MSIRFVSVVVLLLTVYFASEGFFAHANAAGADGFVSGVVTAVGDAIRGIVGTVGRAFAWG